MWADTHLIAKWLISDTGHRRIRIEKTAVGEIWNDYVLWRRKIMPALPEEDQLFQTRMNGEKVWVIEDAVAYTLMYPEDY